ncbi:hypothetical protein F4818DRAFT_121159 [Hypoxylon cercidicola]|nr:hypothetical protein F4818DRAFT_121159 [Hypoxylon cercidicola]
MDSHNWEPPMPNSCEETFTPPGRRFFVWPPPGYVSLSQLELNSQPISELYCQDWTPLSHIANASQGASSSASLAPNLPAEKDNKGSKTDVTMKRDKTKKEDDGFTLDEFWNEPGKDWSKLQLTAEQNYRTRRRKKGMAGCETGPECHTCGSRLDISGNDEDEIIEEIIKGDMCTVCGCFN